MKNLKVQDLMTRSVVTVRGDDNVETLYDRMMDERIRHIPVVDNAGDIVGLVSHRDVVGMLMSGSPELPIGELRALFRRSTVREIMVRPVETVEPECEIEEAARILLENKFGCLPVTENGHLIGILTEADFVRRVAEEQEALKESERVRIARA